METKLRKIGNGYGVLLPKPIIASLRLSDGDLLTLTETETGIQLSPFDANFSEQVEAFRRTESRHRNSYRELAK
jgi:putative addiction module antidote